MCKRKKRLVTLPNTRVPKMYFFYTLLFWRKKHERGTRNAPTSPTPRIAILNCSHGFTWVNACVLYIFIHKCM
jgi:hypothetical protein